MGKGEPKQVENHKTYLRGGIIGREPRLTAPCAGSSYTTFQGSMSTSSWIGLR